MNKTFKGKLASNANATIRLSTNNGLTGYKIIKFQIFPVNFNTSDEYNMQITSNGPSSDPSEFNFDNPSMLAAAYFENGSGVGNEGTFANTVIIDTKVVNQDIFISHKSQSSKECNYYLELEQVKLSVDEAAISTLKNMRGRE